MCRFCDRSVLADLSIVSLLDFFDLERERRGHDAGRVPDRRRGGAGPRAQGRPRGDAGAVLDPGSEVGPKYLEVDAGGVALVAASPVRRALSSAMVGA